MKKIGFVISICSFFVLLDQFTKYLIISNIPLYGKISLLPFLDIVHIRNTGVAFGFLSNLPENFRVYFFVLVFLLAVVLVSIFIYNTSFAEKLMLVSLSLILSVLVDNKRLIKLATLENVSQGMTSPPWTLVTIVKRLNLAARITAIPEWEA